MRILGATRTNWFCTPSWRGHQAYRARGRDRPCIETALHLDQREHEVGRERQRRIALRFAEHVVEDVDAVLVRGDVLREPRLHDLVPDLGLVLVDEAIAAAEDLLQQLFELRIALLVCVRRPANAQPTEGAHRKSDQEVAKRPPQKESSVV
jgi:hypothetical protein